MANIKLKVNKIKELYKSYNCTDVKVEYIEATQDFKIVATMNLENTLTHIEDFEERNIYLNYLLQERLNNIIFQ